VRLIGLLAHALLAAWLGIALPVMAQGRVIQGVVVDSAGASVAYANIIASGSQRRIAAGADGIFRLPLDSSAKRSIDVRRMGYLPVTIDFDTWPDSAIRVVLAPATRMLSAITIAAERSQSLAIRGFYERMSEVDRGINFGYFITPEEIERRKGSRPTDLMTGIPSVRVRRVKTGDPQFRRPQDRQGWEVQGQGSCRMEVYIDGVRLVTPTKWRQNIDENHIFLDDLVALNTIAGIEVYPRSVQAPPKYQSMNGLCGVVLIWTK
jgi:hypothetical protein